MAKVLEIKNSVALVTGGASGLGKAAATRLVKQGAKVLICDLPDSNGAKVASELGKKNAAFMPTDVTNTEQVKEAIKRARSTGFLRIVVNCAGIGIAMPTISKKGVVHSLDQFEKVLQVNVVGTFNVTRFAAEEMASYKKLDGVHLGVIINTASIAAFDGQRGQAAYAASKGAIAGMTLPLARDLHKLGIRVNTIAPGLLNTPSIERLPEKVTKYLASFVPNPPRLGDPDEYAHLVQSLIENQYMNGAVVRCDGALRMPP